MNVAVLGASNKPERYSCQAVSLLAEKGHAVFPVHPALDRIQDWPVYPRLADIPETVNTLTVYVSPERSSALADEILKLKPGRVIFNPGAENPELGQRLRAAGIETLDACTLVLLRIGSFESSF